MGKEFICRDLTKVEPELQLKVLNLLKNAKHQIRNTNGMDGIDIELFETIRTQERQDLLLAQGNSKVKHSKHQDGKAVDIVVTLNKQWTWNTKDKRVLKAYQIIGRCANDEGLQWGGDWKTFIDMPHVELKDKK